MTTTIYVLKNNEEIMYISHKYDDVIAVFMEDFGENITSDIITEIINNKKYENFTIEECLMVKIPEEKEEEKNEPIMPLPPFPGLHLPTGNSGELSKIFFLR